MEAILLLSQQIKTGYKLLASFYEIYNDKILDLLNPNESHKASGLELRENKNGTNQIYDLASYEIKNLDQAFNCIKIGIRVRYSKPKSILIIDNW